MLHSDRIPADWTLPMILAECADQYDDLTLQVQGRTVRLGLIRELNALLEQTRSAQRYADALGALGPQILEGGHP